MDDDELMRLITAGLEPAPTDAVETAHGLLGWRRIDEELAELIEDGADDLAAVRADDGRRLVFEHGDAVADVELRADRVHVVIDPPARIVVERPDGSAVDATDGPVEEVSLELPSGPARLRFVDPDDPARTWATGWFTA